MKFTQALKIAKQAALESNMKFKMGAILYDNNNFVIGFNRAFGCNVNTRNNNFSIHAEEMCILKGFRRGINFEKSILIVVRINKQGNMKCSKPCKNCKRLIEQVGIQKVYYNF